jgi:hypothetical protein
VCKCDICSGRKGIAGIAGKYVDASADLDGFLVGNFVHHTWSHIRFLKDRAGISWQQIREALSKLDHMVADDILGELERLDLELLEKLKREGKL